MCSCNFLLSFATQHVRVAESQLLFSSKHFQNSSEGHYLSEGFRCEWVVINCDFRPVSYYIGEIIKDSK